MRLRGPGGGPAFAAYMGVSRTTFVISPDGAVAKVMHDVKPDMHADDVLGVLATI